jgi:hypothetical protein
MPLLGRGQRRPSKREKKDILIPVEGVDFSRPRDLINDRRGFSQNMVVANDLIRKMYGSTRYGTTAMPGGFAVINLVVFTLQSQSKRLIRASKSVLEQYNTSTGKWHYIPGPSLAADETDHIGFAVASEYDKLVVCQGNNGPLKVYEDGGALADLGGSPPKAGTIDWFSPYLVAGDLEESGTARPGKVRWTDSGDVTNWSTGNAGSANLSYEPSRIQRLLRLNDEEMAYKQNSIYSGRKVSTSEIISWSILKTDVGLFSRRLLASHGGVHWFGSDNDFHVNNGITVQSIGRPVRNRIFDRINTARPEMSWAMVVDDIKEIWFHICVGSNNYPTERWRYNYETGFWYGPDPISGITAGVNYVVVSSRTWDTLVGAWDDQNYEWDDRSGLSDAPIQIFGQSDGNTHKRDSTSASYLGQAIDCYYESIDFVADRFERRKEWAQLDIFAYGSSVDVYYSTDEGVTWTFAKTVTLESTMNRDPYRVYFHVNSSKIRFRLRNNSASDNFVFKALTPYYIVTEDNG